MRTVRSVAAAGCGLVVLLTMGCGQSPKDMQVQALQDKVNTLEAEKRNLMNQLAKAISERDEARARALDLQAQLDQARGRPLTGPEDRWVRRGPIAWTDVADNILFDSGKADLKPAGRNELQDVLAEAKQKFPGRQIWIVGHTDTDPIKHSKWKDNLELSVQRACTVFREMQKLGVDPSNMVAAGQGEFNPKAPNDAKNKHLNRRVQVIAIEVPGPSGALEQPGEQG